jgi:A/G-specific adenine glycosylase
MMMTHEMDAAQAAAALVQRGASPLWNARALPWRHPGEPEVRVALVEGLLAQTRADAVAARYGAIFAGVEHDPREWLALAEGTRNVRVGPLGLPRLKRMAVDSVALGLIEGAGSAAAFDGTVPRPGLGPYTSGMVALLLGGEAAPVDCNVQRVAARVAPDVAPAVWLAEVLGALTGVHVPGVGRPDRYVAISMLLDVGATVCGPARAPECERCPLRPGCAHARRGRFMQAVLAL